MNEPLDEFVRCPSDEQFDAIQDAASRFLRLAIPLLRKSAHGNVAQGADLSRIAVELDSALRLAFGEKYDEKLCNCRTNAEKTGIWLMCSTWSKVASKPNIFQDRHFFISRDDLIKLEAAYRAMSYQNRSMFDLE